MVKKATYVVIETDLEGIKDVLGIWLGSYRKLKILVECANWLENRGVEDILIASIDDLAGFTDVINTAFPKT